MASGLLPKSPVSSSLCDEVPSHIYSKIASRAQRIFDQQCKKTFATISANRRHSHRSKQHLYTITSSARVSSVGEMFRPSTLAVLRLITSSNLVGCSTGKSAGFAPLNTL